MTIKRSTEQKTTNKRGAKTEAHKPPKKPGRSRDRDRGPSKKSLGLPTRSDDAMVKKSQFLDAFVENGRIDLATKHIGVAYRDPYYWAKTDAEFAKSWADAKLIVAQRLEDAAYRRSVRGVSKPVFQRGMLVGSVREYSDALTMFLLRGLKPEVYRDRMSVEASGKDGAPLLKEVPTEELLARAQEAMAVLIAEASKK